MGKGRRWKEDEVKLFYLNKSDEEIAIKTGRTLEAVRMKRRYMKHKYVKPVVSEVFLNPYKDLTQEEKIRRIVDMAKRFQVKLKEE